MRLKKAVITLDVSDVQKVLAIELDEDADKTLEFIKLTLSKNKGCS